MKQALLGLLGVMLAATCAPSVAYAADDRRFVVTPYLWGAGVNGTATVKSHEADVDKSFSGILSDLDFGMMVNLLARKGRFGLYGDVLYLGVTDTTSVTNAAGVTFLEAETSLDSWIIDFGASWEATRWGGSGPGKTGFLDLYLGGRYWSMDSEIRAESQFSAGGRSISQGMDRVDPVIGARFITDMAPKLRLIGAGDIGGFDISDGSKLTWSASAYLGWRFSPMISGWAGYNHLASEREDDKHNSIDLAFSGPVLGVSFSP